MKEIQPIVSSVWQVGLQRRSTGLFRPSRPLDPRGLWHYLLGLVLSLVFAYAL